IVPNSFPTIPAGQLRVGDLIHHPGHGAATYVLVARVVIVDDVVQLMVYDTAHPDGTPATYRLQDRVLLACRDLIEPDDGLRAWTDASWRRAHRRGAAFALMDQIRARSFGRPADIGADADAEIDRLRGRDCGPLPPRVVSATELADLLVMQHRDGSLVLDVDLPAVRAVLALFVQLKAVEGRDGSWDGGDVVAIVSEWFAQLGIDPDRTFDQLDGRVVTTRGAAGRLMFDEVARPAVRPDHDAPGGGSAVIELDRVAELVRAANVECVIDTPGGGVAVLLAGAPSEEPAWAFPWAVQVGPGFDWDGPSLASTRDLRVGPDTADRDAAVLVRELGAVTEE
ncbi:MAG: hypothetical protein L0H64_24355, partial [Pseudonocardia sp.]|nr:hypothetical protein [Pseudonocardia sp.]